MAKKLPAKGRMGASVRSAYEWAESVGFAVVAVVLVFTFLFRVMSVDGSSMEPALHHNDFILLSGLLYTPQNGDVVVIAPTERLDVPIIKRVIATEGQTVTIDFEAGVVTVDNQALAEPYVQGLTQQEYDVSFPQTVPEGAVFVLGDNRAGSMDSRDSTVGMVDTRYIMGRALLRILPLRDFGPIRSVYLKGEDTQ